MAERIHKPPPPRRRKQPNIPLEYMILDASEVLDDADDCTEEIDEVLFCNAAIMHRINR